jgi:uncharacterized membrane protein
MFPVALHLHPIVDHFTIALLSVGVACDAAGALASRLHYSPVRFGAERLRRAALILMFCGAAAAIVSYLSGDADANRLWDTMPPAAQTLLFTDSGRAQFFAHATLGRYLMWTFLALASWRIALEILPQLMRTSGAYLFVAIVATAALLYQGKTGGELVYDYGVGVAARTAPPTGAGASSR